MNPDDLKTQAEAKRKDAEHAASKEQDAQHEAGKLREAATRLDQEAVDKQKKLDEESS